MDKKILIITAAVCATAILIAAQPSFFTQSYGITWSPSWRPSVGHEITATFTWHVTIEDNGPYDKKNRFVIKDPDGNIKTSKELTVSPQGSTTLSVVADKPGNWVAEMWIWYDFGGWSQGHYSKTKNVQPKKYALSVETVPSGARTWIVETGETKTSPCTFYLTKGTYTIHATKSGYGIASKTLSLTTDTKAILSLPPEPKKYRLTVKTNPVNSYVTIAGYGKRIADEDGATFTGLIKGHYIVKVEKNNYETKTEDIYVDKDKTVTITLTPKRYTLTVKTNPPSADVSLVETGETKNSGINGAVFNLNYGTYTVRVEKTGYQTQTTSVTLNEDKTITVDLTEIPPTPPQIEISYTLEVVTVTTISSLAIAALLLKRL